MVKANLSLVFFIIHSNIILSSMPWYSEMFSPELISQLKFCYFPSIPRVLFVSQPNSPWCNHYSNISISTRYEASKCRPCLYVFHVPVSPNTEFLYSTALRVLTITVDSWNLRLENETSFASLWCSHVVWMPTFLAEQKPKFIPYALCFNFALWNILYYF